MTDFELLAKLTETPGISGYERDVKELIRRSVKDYVDKIEEDAMGNLICIKGSGADPKIMVSAHMDQIGLVVKYIEKEGYLRFVKIGGIDDRTLLTKRVTIHTAIRDVHGVIGSRPPHLDRLEDMKKVIASKDLFIDIGARNKKEADAIGVKVGDPVTWDSPYTDLHNGFISGRAFDNRAGVFVLIEAIKKLKNFNGTLYAVFSSQEETGLKGSRTAAFKINPDFCLIVDTTFGGDVPNVKPIETDVKLENGPSFNFVESSGRGAIIPQHIREGLITLAKKARIPYQVDITAGGMTEAAIVQIVREGIACGGISIPIRNIHSIVEVAHKKDIENTIDFVIEAIRQAKIFL